MPVTQHIGQPSIGKFWFSPDGLRMAGFTDNLDCKALVARRAEAAS